MSTKVTTISHPRRRSSAAWIIVIFLMIAAVGAWVYYGTRPVPALVTQRDIVGNLTLNGELVIPPSARADVPAPFRAPVNKVRSSVGANVHRGDVLVELSYPAGQSGADQARMNLQAAETAYANARRQYESNVTATRKQLDSARAAESSANVSTPPSDQSGQSTSSTSSDPGQARSAAELALQQARSDRDSSLVVYKQQLDAAREAYQDARAGARIANVKSPLTGTVLALNAQPGAEVGADPKIPVATVVDLRALKIQADLNQNQVGVVKPGTPVTVAFNEIPGKDFEGKVAQITTRIDSKAAGLVKTQRYVAVMSFKNEQLTARPGMKPNVAVKLGEAKNALAVPAEAIDKDTTGRPIVKVLRNGAWQTVVVEPGTTDGHYTQIKAGLTNGETVQVTPNLLHAGSR